METIGYSGEYLFILQGWGTNYQLYKPIAEMLKDKYRVVLFDFPGFSKSLIKPWTLEDYVQWTNKFISSIVNNSSANINLIGHSFGCRVILKGLAKNKFDFRIGKILLISPAGIKPKRNIKYYTKVYSYKTFKLLYKPLNFITDYLFPIINKKLNNYYNNSGSTDYKVLSENMKKTFANIVNEDLTFILQKIKQRINIIQGEKDESVFISDVKKMNSLLLLSKLSVMPNAGHYPFLEYPNEFVSILNKYFD